MAAPVGPLNPGPATSDLIILPDIAQIAFDLGFNGAPRTVVRQPKTRRSCGQGRGGRCETSPQVCPAASGELATAPGKAERLRLGRAGSAAQEGLHLRSGEQSQICRLHRGWASQGRASVPRAVRRAPLNPISRWRVAGGGTIAVAISVPSQSASAWLAVRLPSRKGNCTFIPDLRRRRRPRTRPYTVAWLGSGR